ncbi:hypothetical protein [Prescottella equi]|uniref:hypothetical protein n=1 Tax=Rhodococcus hoagii TaxID=43767 RepID=UPI002577E33B|nr:hypothetical protein [Prescottella equi]WJJ09870.1 hypothetical protein P9990_14840 [Prescottella equi]
MNYPEFFSMVASLPFAERRMTLRDQVTVIASLKESEDGSYVLRVVTGTKGTAPTLFDLETGEERIVELTGTEIEAASAVIAINPRTRAVAVERRRPGVPLSALERLLASLGREHGYEQLTIALTPIAGVSFLEELEDFERIRRAEVLLTRPNFDWTANATAIVGDLGAASDADVMEVAASASRGQSLRKDSGIVQDIKNFVARPINGLKNVKVFGRKPGGSNETALSLERHQVRVDVTTSKGVAEVDRETVVMNRALELVETLELPSESSVSNGAIETS